MSNKDKTNPSASGGVQTPEAPNMAAPTTQAAPKKYVFAQYQYGSDVLSYLDPKRYLRPELVEELTKVYDFNWQRFNQLGMLHDRYYRLVKKEDDEKWFPDDAPWTADGCIAIGELNNGHAEMYLVVRDAEAAEEEKRQLGELSRRRNNPETNEDYQALMNGVRQTLEQAGDKSRFDEIDRRVTSWAGLQKK